MLAGVYDDSVDLHYPVLVSPKLDGIRCLIVDGKAVTRSFKPIPNDFIRNYLETFTPDGTDGELMLEDPDATFSDVSSAVRKKTGEPNFIYHVFDSFSNLDSPFYARLHQLEQRVRTLPKIEYVQHVTVGCKASLLSIEDMFLAAGFEGVMIRDVAGKYKEGRSTIKEALLLKLKRFKDSEAEILELIEKKDKNKVPVDTLGAMVVRDVYSGVKFKCGVGTGLDSVLRLKMWYNKERYIGKVIKYSFQDVGTKYKPRFPIWLGFRDSFDLGGETK